MSFCYSGVNMKNRIAGALYGQALGDAMGMPSELWSKKYIEEFFGGLITEMLDGPVENEVATNYIKGQFTDDTGQALVLLDSLASTNYIPNTKDVAQRLLEWSERENAFQNNILGPTTKLALTDFREGKNPSKVTNSALSNGSAMRIGPIGAMFYPEQKEKLVDYVYDLSCATHSSDIAIAGAAMIAVGVASAIVNDDFEKVVDDILAIEPIGYAKGAETFSPRLNERVKIGIEIARKYKEQDSIFLQKIYDIVGTGVQIIESVPAAISVAYYARNPNHSAFLCANMGGDTDTIGAMATAICGAFTGVSVIHSHYIEMLHKQNNINFNTYIDILIKGREKLK